MDLYGILLIHGNDIADFPLSSMKNESWLINGIIHGLLSTDHMNGITLIIFIIISINETCRLLVDHD